MKAVKWDSTEVESIVRLFQNGQPAIGVRADAVPIRGIYKRDGYLTQVFNLYDTMGNYVVGGWLEIANGYYTVMPPDAAFEKDNTGVFIYINTPTEDYTCVASYHPLQSTLEAVSFITDAGMYCTKEDVYDIFGKESVFKWANMENLPLADEFGVPIQDNIEAVEARIDRAITFATADINDKLRGGAYTIPFEDGMQGATILYACAIKAGVWLYEWRGADDFDYENGRVVHRYSFMVDRADRRLEQIRASSVILDVTEDKTEGSRVPGTTAGV